MSAATLAPSRPAAPSAANGASRARQPFDSFLDTYRERLAHLFATRANSDRMDESRAIPSYVLSGLRETDPLSVYIPEAYGGRGGAIAEGQAVLEATGYHSLALTLMVGINGALFLQPVGKYGGDAVKRRTFDGFLRHKRLGGLMITEPGYGSDALAMQTSWTEDATGGYHIDGTKHWAGLTGIADYWLMTARGQNADGSLRRDVDFFVVDQTQAGQHVQVEEVYPNLGLRLLPYGRNRVDVRVPASAKLEPESTGVKMMLDLLHRSRLQFPGMGMGFLRRIFDEASEHCRERFVGGTSLIDYDQVRARLARIQAQITSCAALCLDTSENAGVDLDLTRIGMKANAFKTSVTDWMQDASQSFLQLMGGQGYRSDHLAGRATVDSRPFQIFEGSNDILYQQITETVAKAMRKMKSEGLGDYLRSEPTTARAATLFGDLLDFDIDWKMPQRKLVDLGKAISRIVSMEMTIEMGERGYDAELIANALDQMRADVRKMLETYRTKAVSLVEDAAAPDWLSRVRPA